MRIEKVCVRVPENKREELMNIAEKWRAEATASKAPGWDAKAIHEIAQRHFGGLVQMFEHHGWSERGKSMMPAVQAHIKGTYGSVENFVRKFVKS